MVLTKKHEDFSMAMLVYQRVSNALPGISNKFVYVVFFELVLYLQKIRKLLEKKDVPKIQNHEQFQLFVYFVSKISNKLYNCPLNPHERFQNFRTGRSLQLHDIAFLTPHKKDL